LSEGTTRVSYLSNEGKNKSSKKQTNGRRNLQRKFWRGKFRGLSTYLEYADGTKIKGAHLVFIRVGRETLEKFLDAGENTEPEECDNSSVNRKLSGDLRIEKTRRRRRTVEEFVPRTTQ